MPKVFQFLEMQRSDLDKNPDFDDGGSPSVVISIYEGRLAIEAMPEHMEAG